MSDAHGFTFIDPTTTKATAEVVRRFISAFERRDATAIPDLVAADCVMEALQPAPNGLRVEGYDANVAFWQAMVKDPQGSFEVEDVIISGDRAINRWRYRFGTGAEDYLRGVTLITVRDGKVTQALGYGKTPQVSDLGQASDTTASVIRRYNDAFQRHDPAALAELVAEDCVIENSNPAPNGSRHVGREECLALWGRIAGNRDIWFEIEDVAIAGSSATIQWRLRWGESDETSVRGVNLMQVENGQIVKALGYVKGT
ncbi:nuclear transport factor 2 family protein [Frateuria sp. STR12]|uniref:nuclear transport factor 2 family protein n=1 Tax=Frateuria hangzhouensis TaxID=2995589 RepID=UPI002260B748|nr:nuclear transport factor 2 family protein [Frateuria sp. STR12]MCX7515178.1 nuclear transport factor 2 family protein [Frateuria sp. STR12]